MTAPALYAATVTHTRYERVRRTFRYRTFLWLVDLDDLPRLPRPVRALAAFRARDHFAGSAPTIRAGLESWLAEKGTSLDGGRVLMLANAAVLGYVFNPITVFWCLDADGAPRCVVAEVHNTYGGRHAYVLRPDERDRATTAKELYVSPFFPVDGGYAMTVPRPDRRLRLSVTLSRPGPGGAGELAFAASLTGRRRRATVPALLRLLLRFPWAPLRVSALIRWQGIRLWLRRVPVVPRPKGHRPNRTFDVGGPQVLTYADMMRGYARAAGLPRRVIVPVPLLTPWLSGQWVNLVTPVPRSIAMPLIESLEHEAVCREDDLRSLLTEPADPTPYARAVELALARIREADVESHWSTATAPGAPSDPLPSDPSWSGGTVRTDQRSVRCDVPPERLWRVIEGIGGQNGWYSFPLAWAVRGWADRLAGGVGLRRGRRDPARLHLGEALDWWRVEAIERGRLLRLRAEMKVPGQAWLEMSVTPDGDGAVYSQRAVFVPRGLAGQLYWWALWPFHGLIFGGMARNIIRTASR